MIFHKYLWKHFDLLETITEYMEEAGKLKCNNDEKREFVVNKVRAAKNIHIERDIEEIEVIITLLYDIWNHKFKFSNKLRLF